MILKIIKKMKKMMNILISIIKKWILVNKIINDFIKNLKIQKI